MMEPRTSSWPSRCSACWPCRRGTGRTMSHGGKIDPSVETVLEATGGDDAVPVMV